MGAEPMSALAFKVATDPFVGTLTFTRVYSGEMEAGTSVYNSVKGKNERIGRMLQMHANDRTEIKTAVAGDIIAVVGLKDTTTGETLCDKADAVILEKMDFPEPVIKVAVEPKTKADQQKMSEALIKLAAEDPSFRFSRDEETGQTIIEGMGELHLEIIVDRMKREFNVEANVGAPSVSYREAITATAEVDYTHKKQSGGSGQYARVKVVFEPKDLSDEDDMDFEFESDIKGGNVPKEYMGDILGDINSRRGLVGDLGERGNVKTISATVPLANMFQYVSTLRSMSKGRANYSMKLADYDFVPPNVEEELKKGFVSKEED